MIKKYFTDVTSGRKKGTAAGLLAALLKVLSVPFRWAVRARALLYDTGILKTVKAGSAVISVGNLTTGGTGKTQIVKYLAEMFLQRGKNTAIICRSYSGRMKELWVSDGSKLLAGPEDAGDEPYMLARMLKGVMVGAARKRERLVSAGGAEVFILDDAFQYRRLKRDLDIVLLDATRDYDKIDYLPCGSFREGLESLKRAGVVILTKSNNVSGEKLNYLVQKSAAYNKDAEIIISEEHIRSFRSVKKGTVKITFDSEGSEGCVFTALGNPEAFVKSLESAGIKPVRNFFYPDHHKFTAGEIDEIAAYANCFITAKDEVKIEKELVRDFNTEIWVAEPEIILKNTDGAVVKWPKKLEPLF